MTLAELPYNAVCTIMRLGEVVKDSAYSAVAGIRSGATVRVLARFPETNPRLLEIEVGSGFHITVPVSFAREVKLECV